MPTIEPTPRQHVDGGQLLGEHHRVLEVVVEHEGTDLELGGGVGRRHQRRHRPQLVAEVVGHEERVVAQVLRLPGEVGPGGTGRRVGQLDAEAERTMGRRTGHGRARYRWLRVTSSVPPTPVWRRRGCRRASSGAPMTGASATHPELPVEQAYLDRAYAHLARMRSRTKQATEIADNAAQEVDSVIAKAHLNARLRSLDTDVDGLAFGRLDAEDGHTWYVGRRHVEDEASDPVVVDWRAPVSTPFYRATAADPLELRRRRRFLMTGRHVDDLFDEVFDDPDSVDAAHHGGHPRSAAGRARAVAHRRDARHRRDHRRRAGRRDPRAARHVPRRPGRSRHRQDRRRPAPGRLPALRAPGAARPRGGAGRRSQPALPAVHRPGPPVAR